jgi:hypothetical protein
MTYGPAYDASRDHARLEAQLASIWAYIHDQHWFTLGEVEEALGHPQASISAQLRHLRKHRFGGHTVRKRYLSGGLWEYQLHDRHEYLTGTCECGAIAAPVQGEMAI